MKSQDLLKQLESVGAIIKDSHIIYTSGRHGSAYVNKDAVYPHTQLASSLGLQIAETWKSEKPDAVLAPAIGGVVLGQWVAFHLSKLLDKDVLSVYAEKKESGEDFIIKRGYDKLITGKKVLVVEDIITTGGSVQKVLGVARGLGIQLLGLACLCNRGGLKGSDFGVTKFTSLLEIGLDSYDPADCELCKKNVPINTSVGKAAKK